MGRGVISRPRFQKRHDLPATVAGAGDDGFQICLRQSASRNPLTERDSGNRCIAGQGNHQVSVSPQNHRLNLLSVYRESAGEKGAEACRIQNARHPDHLMGGKPCGLLHDPHHHVQGVSHHNHKGVWRMDPKHLSNVSNHACIFVEKVIPAHSGLAGKPSGHNNNIAPG